MSAVLSWTIAPTGIEPARITDPDPGSDPWMGTGLGEDATPS